jgi:hypothetical protein
MPNHVRQPRPSTGARSAQRQRTHASPAANNRRRQCPAERCTRCGVTLPPAEAAFLWHSAIVCGECYTRRQAALVAAALVAPRLPAAEDDPADRRPWWRRTCDLLRRQITLAGLLRRKKRRRQPALAVDPLLAHLHRLACRM